MNEANWNRVYDALVQLGGADAEPYVREMFLESAFVRGEGMEYRFRGLFGMGGKIKRRGDGTLFVDFYPEDYTLRRRTQAARLNDALKLITAAPAAQTQ